LRDSKGYQKLRVKNWINAALVGLLALVVICIVILASVPPVSRDALTHHLAIPKLYVKHGGIYEIPWARWSYYPMNLDLLYMIPLYFGNDIIPKFIHFAFALFTGGLIFGYLKRRTEMFYAIIGVVLFLSLPVIVKLSITVYVDLGLVFFSFAALIYLFKWIETDFRWSHLFVSALCCGLAIGTKYNGLIGFFLLTLFIGFIYSRASAATAAGQIKAVLFSAVFVIIALVIFSPWAVRNFKWTHNPIYPLYHSWFNAAQSKSDPTKVSNGDAAEAMNNSGVKWSHFAVRKIIFNEKWWQIVLIPVRIFFQGRDDDPRYFDGRLNPLLFILPFFAFIGQSKNTSRAQVEKKVLLAYSALFIIITFLQRDMRIRYIGPAIPPLVILSMFGLHNIIGLIENHSSRLPQKIYLGFVGALVLFFFSMNLNYLVQQYKLVAPVRYLTGELQRDAYIEKYRPEYAVFKFANQNLPPKSRILGVFMGNRSYYSNLEMRFDFGTFIRKPLKQKQTDEQILDHFKSNAITHLLIRYDLFNNWAINNFDTSERQRLEHFLNNYASLIYAKNGHGLYRLESIGSQGTRK
jgi:hypothetical protein